MAPPLPRLGEITTLPQTLKSDPPTGHASAPVTLVPYDLRLWHLSWIVVPQLWSP